jgi:hypothetical protein
MTARLFARLFLAAGLITFAIYLRPNVTAPAQAQGVSVSVEFRQALEPHGRWHRHQRWGEVWIPRDARGDWRPYTRGHWVYTEEWGWYWIADEEWGWIPYHYGRWVRDREVGWVWIPGNEWGPAWVSWRRGGEEVGWAPLPPDDVIVEIEDEPDVWIFVRSRDVIAPSIVRVLLPRPRAVVLVRETVVVNRTVFVSGARVAANAGVPPSYIAVAVGRPIRVSRVQPVVLRGTVRVQGAIEVDAKDRRQQRKAVVKQAERSIQPAKDVPKPERLRPGETKQDTPDAPSVLRQAQPQQQQTPDAQKKDAPATQQKKDDAAPKADQKKDDAAPKADQKKDDDRPKADQKKDDKPKEQPKAKQKSDDDAPKAAPKQDTKDRRDDQRKDDTKDRPKADQPKSEQKAQPEQRMQQKRDLPDKSEQPKRDAPKGDMPKGEGPKRDMQPKGDMPKSDAAPKGPPQRQEGPSQKGPGPMRDKKDN